MFKNSFQKGFLSIFYSLGSTPLEIWKTQVENGHIKRLLDEDINSIALEIIGSNIATTYISSPKSPKETLGITMPFLVLLVKNMRKFFSFEVQILDDQNMKRRFRVSNYQSATRVKTFSTSMPLALCPGWNQIQYNLAEFTRRAYGTNYVETLRMQIHANIRIRRIYFTDSLLMEDELPAQYRIVMAGDIIKAPKKKLPKNPARARPPTPVKNSKSLPDPEPETTVPV